MEKIILKGITWGHTRGLVPMQATAQRFEELNPSVEIRWKKRTLQEFADKSIDQLAQEYDLLVIDHPWIGHAATKNIFSALDDLLPTEFLEDQKNNSVGQSYLSYNYLGKQWALPTDAATPVAASRKDLLQERGLEVPKTYDELLDLAEKGLVGFSLIPIDVLMTFYMYCNTLGQEPCTDEEKVISDTVGSQALELFKELSERLDKRFYQKNPYLVFEEMSRTNQIAYCPFAYGYSNYSRVGYGEYKLDFHDVVTFQDKGPLITTLGGAGLAISSSCKHLDVAAEYAKMVADPLIQATLYTQNGGQPGHRGAWLNKECNDLCGDFFKNTLKTLDNAYLRPRYYGQHVFQDHAGSIICNYLKDGSKGDEQGVIDELNRLYKESLNYKKTNG